MTSPTKKRASPPPGRLQQELRQSRPFADLQTEAFLNLVRTADQLQHALASALKSFRVTETQYNALRILRGAGDQGRTCSEIAERLISHAPDITRLLGRMEREGLVRRENDGKDRRVVLTHITQQGWERLQQADAVVAYTIRRLLAHLTDGELRRMRDLLEKTRIGSVNKL
ncbi:MAG: MarR family winged helix-turn-helix transcriptional regulator [Acidobacteriaceae bacterium]